MLMHRAPRSARLAVHIAFVLAGGLPLFPTAAMAEREQGRAATAPSGLDVVVENKPQVDKLDLRALDNPCISGVALQIHWADIEPAEGQPDWTKLDQLFAAAESKGKWVHLLIFTGFFTPDWALEDVKTEEFPLEYGPGKGTVATLPMPWDRVYLTRWFAFVKLLGDGYGNSPAFSLVAADGPTSVSAEFTLPNLPGALKKWRNDGYRPSKYIGAWQEVFQAYAADFPHQYISLSVGAGLNINDQGRIDDREHLRTRQAIVDEAMNALGRRFVLQMSDIHAGPGPHVPSSEEEDRFIIDYNGRIITGFQMRTSAERNSALMGAEGDPPQALRKSIDLAMEPNSAGQRIKYLEIYQPDVVADDLQPDLRYAASLFAPEQH